MGTVLVSEGSDFEIVHQDRSFGGERTTVLRVDGQTGEITADKLEIDSLTGPVAESVAELETTVATMRTRSPIMTGNIGDLGFISGNAIGALAILTEQYGEYVAMNPLDFLEIPTPSETMSGNSDDSLIWVRLDHMQTPYRMHRNFYLGTFLSDGPSISNSGIAADSGLKSLVHLATRFANRLDGFADLAPDVFSSGIHGNSSDGFTDSATIGIAVPYPDPNDPEGPEIAPTVDPFQPEGDFGGAFGAEVLADADVPVFSVCRIDADGYALLAISDTDGHAAGVLAVAQNAGNSGEGSRTAVILKYRDATPVVLETGITPALGEILYVSATEAGKVTNVEPANSYPIGRVLSFVDGVCRVLLR